MDKTAKKKCKDEEEKVQSQQENDTVSIEKDEVENSASGECCKKETDTLKKTLEEKTKQCEEYLNMLQRTVAEFDNYKKRTAREKEGLYTDITGDVVLAFLPVVDNMERAIQASEKEGQSLKEGVELVFRQLKDILKKLGVEEIKSVGNNFDPQLHNAVMHVDDGSFGENVVVDEFQKGYVIKDKVIRHSMVKVAN